jgi:phosphoserine phosphatase
VPPLFAELHKRDYLITIVSASLEFYLDILQNDLDFDTFYASQLEVINGKFTGECKLAVTDKTKSLYIKSIKKNNSLIVVGDSQGDVPMLELADKGFYLLHKSGSNIDEKPDLANVEIVTHENVVEKILAVA